MRSGSFFTVDCSNQLLSTLYTKLIGHILAVLYVMPSPCISLALLSCHVPETVLDA